MTSSQSTEPMRAMLGQGIADELPNELARTVGQKWLERYGDCEDKAFVAACVYRMMRLAILDPTAPVLDAYR
jgi:hypothetical protein